MTIRWIPESKLALKAVSAGAEILDREFKEIPFKKKESSGDIVTGLDIAIEEKIRAILKESKYPVVGEELKNSGAGFTGKGGVWVV
ncbi:MAG TPA: hypothetical protein PKI44_05750, partial [Candidatus Omnitrophota bacterium]|nr:hypothetical protein [Candidatus Omnitrophota bacterium]